MPALHTADMGDVEQFYSRRLLSVALSSHPRLPTSSLDLQKDFSFSCQHMKLLALSEASLIQSALNVHHSPTCSYHSPSPRGRTPLHGRAHWSIRGTAQGCRTMMQCENEEGFARLA